MPHNRGIAGFGVDTTVLIPLVFVVSVSDVWLVGSWRRLVKTNDSPTGLGICGDQPAIPLWRLTQELQAVKGKILILLPLDDGLDSAIVQEIVKR
jgi:hypothetical protein